MESPLLSPLQSTLPSAFAEACRFSHSDGELFDRCREALVRRFGSERIWFSVTSPDARLSLSPPPDWLPTGQEIIRLRSGQTDLAIVADPAIASAIRPQATSIALGLSVMLELHGVLRERQAQLDDAVFQLRAMRQVARLLSSVHSTEESESMVLDFMAEVFFSWWACLYRPAGARYVPKVVRSLKGAITLDPIDRDSLDRALPLDQPVGQAKDAAIGVLMPPTTQLVVSLGTGAERLAVLALGPRLHDQPYGASECDLANTLAFAASIALKNALLVTELQSAATTDPLTGLMNRRAMEERLEAELSRAQRHPIRSTILAIDLDRFKLVNDSLGHAAGDRFLAEVARTLKQQARTLDAVGRMGG
ncbi:MAG: GGDEF domain-containing protein, partial [Gemmatimonadota bacterium]|nr:GGDEF domain-containing protein [Gemmatimonadota bacterium]